MSFNIETTGMGSSSEITQAVADLSGAEVRLAMAGFNVLPESVKLNRAISAKG